MSLPTINLDDRTFADLVQEAKKQIPIYAPAWTDHNAHDPGITLIELFAWLTEMQIYQLNRVTDESKWKFLQLMKVIEEDTPKNDEDKENDYDIVKTLDEGILRARNKLKTVNRAVTAADYEDLLVNAPESVAPEIARAKVIPRYHPHQHQEVPGIVTVVVVPKTPILEPGKKNDFLGDVYQYLEQYRMLATELFIMFPHYVQVAVEAEIETKPQYLENKVKKNVMEKLNIFLDPVKGGPGGTGWPFGRPVYVSEIYQVIDGVEGVDYVTQLKLKKENGEFEFKNEDIVIPEHSLVCPGEHQINKNKEK